MKIFFKKNFVILFFFIFFIFPAYALAAGIPFINKAKVRHIIPSGQTAYGEITLENPTSEIKQMKLYLEDWYYLSSSDGAKEFAPADTTRRSCASWITFSPQEFSVAPFGKQRVSYSIKVPQDTSGGYYAALFFENMVGEMGELAGGTAAGISLAIRIASLFYVEVEGTIKRSAELTNLILKKEPKGTLSIQADFENTGNTDITAVTSYHILDKKGMVYARGEFNDVYTLAGEKAILSASWSQKIPEGEYDLIITMNIGKALEEANLGRGPVITKETSIEIGEDGEVSGVGELR
ncbi:MAG: hypothetical protein AB1481_04895 [Candidatus Omnitrophota bacterium]